MLALTRPASIDARAKLEGAATGVGLRSDHTAPPMMAPPVIAAMIGTPSLAPRVAALGGAPWPGAAAPDIASAISSRAAAVESRRSVRSLTRQRWSRRRIAGGV